MPSAHQEISVVICAYTEARWNDLVAAVESVRKQTTPPREIFVVVDHNNLLFERAAARFVDLVILHNQGQRGLSDARNTGIRAAKSAIIAFMDEDAVAAPNWLEQLENGYIEKNVLGVGGSIRPLWNTERPPWFPEEFDWVVGCTYRGMPEETAPIRNLIGCNMSFRREVLLQLGGFRNGIGRIGAMPFGCEETELCIRARQRWPTEIFLYEPRARVYHRVPPLRAQVGYFRARCIGEGISKAQIVELVGGREGLASERAYTLHTLTRGFLRSLLAAVLAGDIAGFGRAGAIVLGLVLTAGGYLTGKFALRLRDRSILQNGRDPA
jgi:glycosyltransferase involved in cell wall biosynthesis